MLECHNLDDAYYQALFEVMWYGYLVQVDEGSFAGQHRLQLKKLSMEIKHPEGMRPFITTPETKAHLAVCTDKYIEEEYINYLMGTKKADNEAYTYGQRINEIVESSSIKWFDGHDMISASVDECEVTQLQVAIEKLKRSPGNNQACIAIERPSDILLADPPCLRTIDMKIVDGKLDFGLYFRSWDGYAGLPVNLAGLQLMKEGVSVMLDRRAGDTCAFSIGYHVYQADWLLACERLGLNTKHWAKIAGERLGCDIQSMVKA